MKTQTHDNGDVSVTLTPLSTSEISNLYGISRKTLKKWLTPFRNIIGEKIGRFYTVAQVKIIFDKLGLPNATMTG